MTPPPRHPLVTLAEVARLFKVSPHAASRWEKAGRLTALRTLGGHRRFFRAEVEALLRGKPLTAEQVAALKEQYGGRG